MSYLLRRALSSSEEAIKGAVVLDRDRPPTILLAMMRLLPVLLPAAFAAASFLAAAAPITERAAADTTTVLLNTCSGSPVLYGAGLLYGISGTDMPPQSCELTLTWRRGSALPGR